MGIKSRKTFWAGVSMLVGALVSSNAAALPVLQLYIEGATYDPVEESWYYPGRDFRLWTIGNLTGPAGTGGLAITNVRLAVVYDDPGTPVTITLTPTRIGGAGSYSGFSDPSTPVAPGQPVTVTDGSTPWIVGNKFLPNHGEYGAGKTWQEFWLGSFTTADSQLADFVGSFPAPGVSLQAQINAYDVHVEGADAHFDLYAQYQNERGQIHHLFATPGHDATDGPAAIPLPATWALLGIGALALGAIRRKSR